MNPNQTGATSPSGKPFPEYHNPLNIPISYVGLDNPFMQAAYQYAKKKHATKGLSGPVKKMGITSATLVKNGKIIGQGCNGNGWHQEHNRCVRVEKNMPTGVGYEECPGCQSDHHGERSAFLNATEDATSADLYMYGHWWICTPCWNAITEHKINHIYILENADTLFDRTQPGSIIGTTGQYAGKIIVIEGSDGTGKETQTNLLKENLQNIGYTVGTVSFPQYNSQNVGGRLLKYVLKSDQSDSFMFSKIDSYAASMLYAMDRRETKPLIDEMLQEYDFLVMDRYYTANLLHQGSKFTDTIERNAFLDTIHNIEVTELGLPEADLITYLTLPFEVALARMEKRRNETGESIDQAERDHEHMKDSILKGLEIATHLNWNIIQGVEFASDGTTVTKEYSKEERQEMLLELLRNKSFIKKS
jgi:dTMP kinase